MISTCHPFDGMFFMADCTQVANALRGKQQALAVEIHAQAADAANFILFKQVRRRVFQIIVQISSDNAAAVCGQAWRASASKQELSVP